MTVEFAVAIADSFPTQFRFTFPTLAEAARAAVLGDYVVVVNADKLVLTGNKADSKVYYRHSGFPGGIKERSIKEVKELDASAAVVAAVKGMLPRNKQLAERLKRLRVFNGESHDHAPQQPVKVEVK